MVCILEEFKRLCCVLCYLGSLTLLRAAEEWKEGETQDTCAMELGLGEGSLIFTARTWNLNMFIKYSSREGLTSLYGMFCIMAVVGYKHPREDSVASFCTLWSNVLNHFWEKCCHFSWARPIWVTALTNYHEPIGLGALKSLGSCQITHFLSTFLTHSILCSLKKGAKYD